MLTLFHFGGAICAQKVRLALAEKGWNGRAGNVLAKRCAIRTISTSTRTASCQRWSMTRPC